MTTIFITCAIFLTVSSFLFTGIKKRLNFIDLHHQGEFTMIPTSLIKNLISKDIITMEEYQIITTIIDKE